jgi:hypothetical protein
MEIEGWLRKCLGCFIEVNGSGKQIKVCMKIYDEITKVVIVLAKEK